MLGVTRSAIRHAVDAGRVVSPVDGWYALAETEAAADPTEWGMAVACAVTGGVVGGESAALWHGLTDALPDTLTVLVPLGYSRVPQGVPWTLKRMRFPASLRLGVEERQAFGQTIRVTGEARTVVDLYRFKDTAQHRRTALAEYLARGRSVATLRAFSRPFDRKGMPALDSLFTEAEAVAAAHERMPR